jgi:hypothetical protein
MNVLSALYEAAQPAEKRSLSFEATEPFRAAIERRGDQIRVSLDPEDEERLGDLLEMDPVGEDPRSKVGFKATGKANGELTLAIGRGALWSCAANLLIQSNEDG